MFLTVTVSICNVMSLEFFYFIEIYGSICCKHQTRYILTVGPFSFENAISAMSRVRFASDLSP